MGPTPEPSVHELLEHLEREADENRPDVSVFHAKVRQRRLRRRYTCAALAVSGLMIVGGATVRGLVDQTEPTQVVAGSPDDGDSTVAPSLSEPRLNLIDGIADREPRRPFELGSSFFASRNTDPNLGMFLSGWKQDDGSNAYQVTIGALQGEPESRSTTCEAWGLFTEAEETGQYRFLGGDSPKVSEFGFPEPAGCPSDATAPHPVFGGDTVTLQRVGDDLELTTSDGTSIQFAHIPPVASASAPETATQPTTRIPETTVVAETNDIPETTLSPTTTEPPR